MIKCIRHISLFGAVLLFFQFKALAQNVLNDISDPLTFKVIDIRTKNIIPNALFEIVDGNSLDTLKLESDNIFRYQGNAKKHLRVKISAETDSKMSIYLTIHKEFKRTKDNALRTIELIKIDKNSSFDNLNIYFDNDSYKLNKNSIKFLKGLYKFMSECINMEIQLVSYTDCKEKNQLKLSTKRNLAAKQFLLKRGIDENRLSSVIRTGKSPTNVCDCKVACTEEQYQQNRRLVFWITKFQ